MNVSLFLTRQCNLRCKYCFETHEQCSMSEETALRAVEFAANNSVQSCGISFFGGEPLLQKDLIYKCVEYAGKFTDKKFSYNITTNGLLLEEKFLNFASENRVKIAMSHDGLMSRNNRIYADGRDCLAELDGKLQILLHYQPNAFIMATVAANTVHLMAESVIYLYERGVKTLNLAIDMRPNAGWNDALMYTFAAQLDRICNYILSKFSEGKDVYFNSFEEKILSITKNKSCHMCKLGKRKPYIDTNGSIYPCIQFNGHGEYRIGDVFSGIDALSQERIYIKSLKKPECCKGCALETRCINDCACANFQQCGDMNAVSPVQCRYQRILIEKADDLARRMLEVDEEHFIRRYFKK